MNYISHCIKKLIRRLPILGWFGILFPLSKLIKTVVYNFGLYELFDLKVKGLHLGSGDLRINHFLNIDGNPCSNCDLIGGVQRIRLNSNNVDCIYTSHVFEHITRSNVEKVLIEWCRVLKPNGKLYICVPNLESLFQIYLDGIIRYEFDESARKNVDLATGIVFGGQINRYDFHYYGYSFKTLKHLLESRGFYDVSIFDNLEMKSVFPRDASFAEINGTQVSLNVVATKN